MRIRKFVGWLLAMLASGMVASFASTVCATEPGYSVQQITEGPLHHFFGYIGHVGNVPWNGNGRFIVALRTDVLGRMPGAEDAADIVLIDTQNEYQVKVLDKTRAWNPQQGTMLYWNPSAADTQFFFNDRDSKTGRLFTVLFDVSKGSRGERIREYRYDDVSIANGGVAQEGGFFYAINYGRMARLRPVTGYKDAFDWTQEEAAPKDDGVFVIDVESKEKRLLVSFAKMRDELRVDFPTIDSIHLFVNHTLSSRDNKRVYFFARGNWKGGGKPRVNEAFSVAADGSELTRHQHIGGHPEWDEGCVVIGRDGDDQIRYDVVKKKIVGKIGSPELFPQPEGDIALSTDGKRFVNGYGKKEPPELRYTILNRETGRYIKTRAFSRGKFVKGDLRIDPSPRWNRDGTQIIVPGIADDGTRQMFLIEVEGL